MILYRLPKEQRSSYVNNLMINEEYIVARYADKNLKTYQNTAEIKSRLIEENEKVISYYNKEYRYKAGKTVFLGMLAGYISCFVTKAIISIHIPSLGIAVVLASIAVASSIYGLKKTINAYLTLMDLSSVDKAIYLMENKEVINKHVKEKYQAGFAIDKKSPYKCLNTIFKKTGEIELNINNLHMATLKQLREIKRMAEMANVIPLSNEEPILNYNSGARVKK